YPFSSAQGTRLPCAHAAGIAPAVQMASAAAAAIERIMSCLLFSRFSQKLPGDVDGVVARPAPAEGAGLAHTPGSLSCDSGITCCLKFITPLAIPPPRPAAVRGGA